jgi:hypothetical protein
MSDRAIEEAVRKLAGTQFRDNVTVVQATVVSYDIPSRTCYCTPISGEAVTDLPNVQLMAEVDDGILLLPTVGSTVFVVYSTHHAPFIALFSEVDQIILISGGAQIKISNTGLVQFNDGTYGGLIQIAQLITKLNNLEKDLNTLKTAFTTWVPVPDDGGAALKAETATWAGDEITLTLQAELENTTVTHGQLLE